MNVSRFGFAAAVAAAIGVLYQPAPAQAALTKQELKCSATVAKSFSKLQATILKTKAKCHNDDISAKADSVDGCDTLPVKSQEKVDKAKDKFVSKVAKACQSVCSLSNDIVCVTNLSCPPNNAMGQQCLGKGGTNPFSLRNLDWPGPYCDSILGHSMTTPSDLGECLVELVDKTAEAIDEAVYADIDETTGLDDDAAKCLSSLSKAVSKNVGKSYLATADCRDARRSANNANQPPYACATQDAETAEAIQDGHDSLSEAVTKSCNDAAIADLTGLCATGDVTPTTTATAASCLSSLVREVATAERGFNNHVWSPTGMLNATHPDSAAAYCGDGQITRKREEHTGVGEECDGENDSACGAGSCYPPGDTFECTCDTTPRERFIVNGDESATDSDAGWFGSSHEATHNDGFGYLSELSNCTCSAFAGATCATPSGDDICDVRANMAPRCSDDQQGTETCDQRGDNDGLAEGTDCYVCDANSLNAGDWCATGVNNAVNESACNSQCFVDETGAPTATPCSIQGDCPAGQTCKGRCDNTVVCNRMTEGSPLPLISAAIPVCIMLEFKTDVTGTKNMVTGETVIDYNTRSLVALGAMASEPCPVCGGVCLGGAADGDPCFGRCDASNDPCLFDSDCTGMGDTACLETADDCTGGSCSLDLRCSTGANAGRLCRPDSATKLGVVSHDCPPIPNETISGTGVPQLFNGTTTEIVEFPPGGPCTDPSWGNYNCPCPADAPPNFGVPTRPNLCAGACDGGINVGKGCVTGTGGAGDYTTCVGGAEAGLPCDADADCDSLNCSDNPLECTAGDTALLGTACTVNANCGGGGVCGDACPGARCVPLCLEEGVCAGGARDGNPCATVQHCKQCTGGNPALIGAACDTNQGCNTTTVSGDGVCEAIMGVSCNMTDPEDGLCAAGPVKFSCTGSGYSTVPCTLEYGTCTMGACTKGSASLRGDPCVLNSDCVETQNVPVSSGCETGLDSLPGTADDIPGAGECGSRPESCFVNNGLAEGGDTLNGDGSATDVNINAAFCTPANSNSGVNTTSGFGGPSRVRRQGTAIVNVPSIP